jgi:hypothetical protein
MEADTDDALALCIYFEEDSSYQPIKGTLLIYSTMYVLDLNVFMFLIFIQMLLIQIVILLNLHFTEVRFPRISKQGTVKHFIF